MATPAGPGFTPLQHHAPHSPPSIPADTLHGFQPVNVHQNMQLRQEQTVLRLIEGSLLIHPVTACSKPSSSITCQQPGMGIALGIEMNGWWATIQGWYGWAGSRGPRWDGIMKWMGGRAAASRAVKWGGTAAHSRNVHPHTRSTDLGVWTPHLKLGNQHEIDDVHDRALSIAGGHIGLQKREEARRRGLVNVLQCGGGGMCREVSWPHLQAAKLPNCRSCKRRMPSP